MRAQTWGGILVLCGLILAGLVLRADQPSARQAPEAVTVATPAPAPPPDAWGGPRSVTANLALLSWLAALGLLPLLAIGGAVAWGRHRSRLIDLERPPLVDRESIRLAYQAKTVGAGTPPLTHLHLSNRVHGAEPVLTPALPPTGPLPGLEELLRAPGIVYGYGPQGPLIDRRATSVGIGGMPGSGKSSTAALLLAQHDRRGARLLIGDPHAGAEESLMERLTPLGVVPAEVGETPGEIVALAGDAHKELERRQRTWRLIPPADVQRVVLAIDEWTSLLRGEHAARLLDLLEDIAQQGRKYGVAVLLIAQSWSAAAVGSSQLRNPLPAAVMHRMRPDEARMLSGLRGEAVPADTLDLPPGHAYVVGVDDGIVRARVPSLGAQPVLRVPSASLAGQPAASPGHSLSTLGAQPDDSRRRQVLELAARGTEIREIIRVVYGIEKTGAPYTAAQREVWTLVTGQMRTTEDEA